MKDKIIAGLIIVGSVALMGWAVASGSYASETVECQKWQTEADGYKSSGFYLLKWQAEQCAAHDIIINAPVHWDTN